MAQFGIVSPGYQSSSLNINASRMINFFPELSTPDGKTIAALIGTPGTELWASTTAAVRGLHVFNDKIYFVVGNKLFSIDNDKTISAQLGTDLSTSTGRVVFANNGLSPSGGDQIVFVDGVKIYCFNVSTAAMTVIDETASTVCFVGGYFIADVGGAQFQTSDLYDGATWSALNVGTAESNPDNIAAVANNHGELWIFGEYSTEVWYQDTGNPPFTRVSGGVINYGCAAKHSVAEGGNTLYWLATQKNANSGQILGIVAARGYGVELVSPQSINATISKYAVTSDAFAYFYTDQGHEFYVLTFPSENATWVFDTMTKLWHERSSYDPNQPFEVCRHLSEHYCFFSGKHIVTDYSNGNFYKMALDIYEDNSNPLISTRITNHLFDNENLENVFIKELKLDVESGGGSSETEIASFLDTPMSLSLEGGTLGTLAFTLIDDPLLKYSLTGNLGGDPGTVTVNINASEVSWVWPSSANDAAMYENLTASILQTGEPVTVSYVDDGNHASGIYISEGIEVEREAEVSLYFSNDFGRTWTLAGDRGLGKKGEYKKEVKWHRLGAAKGKTFKIQISSPIKKVLLNQYVQVEKAR